MKKKTIIVIALSLLLVSAALIAAIIVLDRKAYGVRVTSNDRVVASGKGGTSATPSMMGKVSSDPESCIPKVDFGVKTVAFADEGSWVVMYGDVEISDIEGYVSDLEQDGYTVRVEKKNVDSGVMELSAVDAKNGIEVEVGLNGTVMTVNISINS